MGHTTGPCLPFACIRHHSAELQYRIWGSCCGPVSYHSCSLLSRLLWLPRKDIPSWFLQINPPNSPGFAPAPQQQHFSMPLCLPYMQLHYLNFQPKLVAQYEPKLTQLWCLQKTVHYKEDGVNFCREASFLYKEKGPMSPLSNQQAKQQGIKLLSQCWESHHAACRLPSHAWGKYLAFCPHFSVANQGY